MPSAKSVIVLALSKLGVAGAAKSPRLDDLNLALTTLQSTYRYLISSGALGRARPVTPPGDYVAGENERIFRTSNCVGKVKLPELVHDHHNHYDSIYYDDDYCSRPRPPRDGAYVVINDARTGGTVEFIYEGYTNRWISLHDLSLQETENITDTAGNVVGVRPESTAPLSMRDLNGLAALLAVKLADHYATTPSPLTIRDALNWQAALSDAFGEPERAIPNDLIIDSYSTRY